jgi:hypothetical protein
VAAVAELELLAHGGVGGAIVESLLVLGIALIFAGLWFRERRARELEEAGDEEDQIRPQ